MRAEGLSVILTGPEDIPAYRKICRALNRGERREGARELQSIAVIVIVCVQAFWLEVFRIYLYHVRIHLRLINTFK